MATDWARYMVERPDVYDEFRKSGLGFNWTWDRGRREGDGMRNDGKPIGNATAAEYAQAHYNNFGKREGMQLHERTDDSFEQKLRAIDGGASGGPSGGIQSEMMAMIESLQNVIDNPKSTEEEVTEALETTQTILTGGLNLDEKKKKSLLTPITVA